MSVLNPTEPTLPKWPHLARWIGPSGTPHACLLEHCHADGAEILNPNDIATLEAKLDAIESLCRKYDHPGVNTGAHDLARTVLNVLRGVDS